MNSAVKTCPDATCVGSALQLLQCLDAHFSALQGGNPFRRGPCDRVTEKGKHFCVRELRQRFNQLAALQNFQ